MAVKLDQSQVKARERRGLAIVNKENKQVQRIDDFNYEVLSQSGNGSFILSPDS